MALRRHIARAGAATVQTVPFRRGLLRRLTLALALSVSVSASGAVAAQATPQDRINATLSADPVLWQGLFTLALADQIRTHCPSIEARTLRTTSFVLDVYNRARSHGFSRPEIRAFQIADSTEARLRAEVMAYFAANGVREGAAETYCALGQAEIAAGSQAGVLLRAR